jgi:hypothetical protein
VYIASDFRYILIPQSFIHNLHRMPSWLFVITSVTPELITSYSELSPCSEATSCSSNPTFYVTQRFITMYTSALHQSLTWARSIQSIPAHLSKTHFNNVHPSMYSSSCQSLSFWPSHQYPTCITLSPICTKCHAHIFLLITPSKGYML